MVSKMRTWELRLYKSLIDDYVDIVDDGEDYRSALDYAHDIDGELDMYITRASALNIEEMEEY